MTRSSRKVKCVVWDLDNTIWDGVLLEGDDVRLRDGVEDVLRTLDERGILHSLASRNDAELAEAKLEELGIHEFFVHGQISWDAKSVSVRRIAEALNISTDSLAFVDDDPFERDEVAMGVPDVLCIEADASREMVGRPEFTPSAITTDSRHRRSMVKAEVHRAEIAETMAPAEFLESLDMVMTVGEATPEDLDRVEELTLRTNQLNSTGYTFSRDELEDIRDSPSHRLYVAGLDDRYGTYGRIGLALVELQDDCSLVRLFVISCRVMARGVGPALLRHLVVEADARGVPLRAQFIRSDRNRPMYLMFKFGGFREIQKDDDIALLECTIESAPPAPSYVTLDIDAARSA